MKILIRPQRHGSGFTSNLLQSLPPFIDAHQCLPRFLHSVEGEIERHAIMDSQEHVPHLASSVAARDDVTQSVEITERLRHLLVVHQEMRAMHPITHKLFSRYPFALRNLCFVMWKDVVYAAAMNI